MIGKPSNLPLIIMIQPTRTACPNPMPNQFLRITRGIYGCQVYRVIHDWQTVLQHSGRILFGIDDVTGHGLENGALAIMIQSSIRTLLANDETDPVKLIVVRSGKLELIDTIDLGFPIGLDEKMAEFVHQVTIPLNTGDVVVLYTDGITEAENIAGKMYGLESLCEIIQQNWQQTAQEIQQAVITDVHQFIREQKVFDDITLLVLKQK